MAKFISLGIPKSKLLMGLPWYGYNYTCVNQTEEAVCPIKLVPFRGVNCSDAAGIRFVYLSSRQIFHLYFFKAMRWITLTSSRTCCRSRPLATNGTMVRAILCLSSYPPLFLSPLRLMLVLSRVAEPLVQLQSPLWSSDAGLVRRSSIDLCQSSDCAKTRTWRSNWSSLVLEDVV